MKEINIGNVHMKGVFDLVWYVREGSPGKIAFYLGIKNLKKELVPNGYEGRFSKIEQQV